MGIFPKDRTEKTKHIWVATTYKKTGSLCHASKNNFPPGKRQKSKGWWIFVVCQRRKDKDKDKNNNNNNNNNDNSKIPKV